MNFSESYTRAASILIIDDDEAKRLATAAILRQAGFEVEEATNGRDGLWVASAKLPSLVVLDVNLPDISGFEVLASLKARDATASIPVLHLSTTSIDPAIKVEGLERGADGYLAGDVEPLELIATVRSLLRARKSEEMALELSRQWQATFDAITDGVCVLDNAGVIKLANRRLSDLLSSPQELLTGHAMVEVLATQLDITCSYDNVEVPSGERWFLFKTDAIVNELGVGVGSVVTIHETTARKREEQELQEAKIAAEAANRSKSSFLANMSHEIRTPLGAILGYAELLQTGDASPQESQDYLKTIHRNATDLSNLVNDILDLSKVEAGRLDIESLNFSLTELLRDVMNSLQIKAESKGIVLRFSAAPGLPTQIVSDPTRLRQILLNVIGNAIKFTDEGSVEVTAKVVANASTGARRIEFHVKDTGNGISAVAATRLFHPFSQGDNSMTRRFGGTGLGLMLSRRLARALGGDLDLEFSELGAGSTFVFHIDATKPTTDVASVKPADTTSPLNPNLLKGVQVLLVEDAPDISLLMQRFLQRSGASVDMVDNGMLAVEYAMRKHYDVILMDMQMPIQDGYSATKELRARGYTRPIVALTAHAMADERIKSLKAGCNDHLTKPVSVRNLIRTVAELSLAAFNGGVSAAESRAPSAPS